MAEKHTPCNWLSCSIWINWVDLFFCSLDESEARWLASTGFCHLLPSCDVHLELWKCFEVSKWGEEKDEDPSLEYHLSSLREAKESGVVYLVGHGDVKARKDSWFLKKLVINYFYAFMRANCRAGPANLSVPHTNLLQVMGFKIDKSWDSSSDMLNGHWRLFLPLVPSSEASLQALQFLALGSPSITLAFPATLSFLPIRIY